MTVTTSLTLPASSPPPVPLAAPALSAAPVPPDPQVPWVVPLQPVGPLVTLAEVDYDAASASLPAEIPASWTGSVAQACQQSLDEAVTLVRGIAALLASAYDAAAALDSVGRTGQTGYAGPTCQGPAEGRAG